MQLQTAQAIAINIRDQELKSNRPQSMIYMGTSMLPLIDSGATITINPVTTRELSFADIVAYEFKGRIYVNRFYFAYTDSTNTTKLIVKGDNRHNFRRLTVGSFTGRVVAIQGTRISPMVSYICALFSGSEGCAYRAFGLKPKVKPGITMIAYLLSFICTKSIKKT